MLLSIPDFMNKTTLVIIFIVLAILTVLQMFLTKAGSSKAGLFTLLRIAIEVVVLLYLYFTMKKYINNDNSVADNI